MARSKFLGINPKYFVVAQFTRHIREGMTMLKSTYPNVLMHREISPNDT
jgi:hypothetical protein